MTWMKFGAAMALTLAVLLVPVAGAEEQPGQRLAYVSNVFSSTISVFNLDEMRWLRDFTVGPNPIFSMIDPHNGDRVVLALHNYGRKEDDDALVIVDLATEKVVKRVPYPGAGMPSGFVYDRKRDRFYIADENLHRVFVHDGTTLDLLAEYPAGLIPVHVDLSPDARWLVATNRKSADLYVYDLEHLERGAKGAFFTIHLGPTPGADWAPGPSDSEGFSHPVDVKFSDDPALCYVTDMGLKRLLYVDLVKRVVRQYIQFTSSPFDIALNAARTIAYVCQVDADRVSIVDLAGGRIVAEIPDVTANPIHCVLDEAHEQLVVANWGNGESGGINIIDLKTRRVLKRIEPAGAKGSVGITLVTRRP